MSDHLSRTQQILARLYTDRTWRERFFTNPQAVSKEFDFNEQLTQISAQQVNLFASSLQRKRLGQIRVLLPLTQQILGQKFSQLFGRYAPSYQPQGIKKHHHDALHFCEFIAKIAASETIEPVWAVDIVRYEQAWLQTTEPNFHFTYCYFNYAIEPLITSLQQQVTAPTVKLKPTVAIWLRLSQSRKLWCVAF